jgi:adenosylcobinamide amidohydrolase
VNLELVDGPTLVWRLGPGRRMISSGVLGGGLGPREWVINVQVPGGYSRHDPVEHLRSIAAELGLRGPGAGLLTAAEVARYTVAADGGVEVAATVGLRVPTWAAVPEGHVDPELAPEHVPGYRPLPGTINIVVSVPANLGDAALVNAVATATEAKTQALLEAGYPCTGTASDALCVAADTTGPVEDFGGPRSVWGARIARAVHAAVGAGAMSYRPGGSGAVDQVRS